MNDTVKTGERIAKVMARAGLCSRRDAERWIADRRVEVNGSIITSPALNITSADVVVVDGKALPGAEKTRLFRFNKPPGMVTTNRDPQGRPTIFDGMPPGLPRVIAVGRLDMTSEGLLLLTNDGELSRHLELPSTGWVRRYRVRAFGRPTTEELDSLKNGVTVEGVRYGPITAEMEKQQGANCWLTVSLSEGKNREVRRVLEHLHMKVNRLIRISYGPFQLGTLPEGAIEEVSAKMLREQIPQFFKKAQ